ncbi:MAG: hypothetical protein J4478_01900 [Candidatus Diapherotrites archaeon]|uniref:Yip1 domain-containing protein n=1 Tax=Candidatus Iainarchaeum sp. TaxID=3101447 RepID=A0A7J4KRZ7_9ARCH|nr:hypothetical protein [Candidatus Diapherotrites archaeon]HIH21403.1 hypothetical protein [Candidatus Diapherotrites archaeon]HIH32801.1 hypothetical protein [Candidatus Diapherotrites archaeon]
MALKDVNGFNPLEVFFHPKKTVEAALEFPNIYTAVALILAPWVLGVIAFLAFGLNASFASISARIAIAVGVFFFQAVLIYLVAKGFEGKGKNLFEGVVSAFSLTQMIPIVLTIFMFLALLFNPSIAGFVKEWAAGDMLTIDLVDNTFNALASNIISGFIFLLIGAILVIYLGFLVLYLNYLVIKQSTKASVFVSIVLMLVVFIISSLVQQVLEGLVF